MAISSSVFNSTLKKQVQNRSKNQKNSVLNSIGQISKAHHSGNKLSQQYNTLMEVTILFTTGALSLHNET